VYQWLTGAFIRVGFLLFIVVDLFNLNENRKRIWTMIAPPFFFLSLSLSLLNDDLFLEIKGNYFLICTFVFLIVLSLFLTIVAFASRKTVKNV